MREIDEAIILGGGLGERLRPMTLTTPKILISVAGKPILQWQIDWLRSHGVKKVVVACGHLSDRIEDYLLNANLGVSTELSIEKDRLGTGGALLLALPRISGKDFFVLNGDIISKIDLGKFRDYYLTMGKIVSIIAAPLRLPYGIVTVFNGLLQSFVEKPELPNWINGGIYIFSRNAGEFLPEVGDLETEVFPRLLEEISVYMSREMWIPIDTVKDLREAERLLGGPLNPRLRQTQT